MTAVLAIDQGTTSSRAIVFDGEGRVLASAQQEHRQITPRPGWVEHDAAELWENVREVVALAVTRADVHIDAIGITNQRETAVVWDVRDGAPIHHAIVWQDTRTAALVRRFAKAAGRRLTRTTGLPPATYFSAPKVRWLLDNVDGAREAAGAGHLRFGTIDSWLLWKLTGGTVHATDITNASRTMLMSLESGSWDMDLVAAAGLEPSMLPEIHPSLHTFADTTVLLDAPITAVLGDQQAATFGQACFDVGQAKNTYGTGNFLLSNTGTRIVRSRHGLITTVAYQRDGEAPVYALEGSVAVTGAAVQWLRDNLGLIRSAAEVEALAGSVPDNGGVYFVPAFSGLFAPHWRSDARGVIAGLTSFATAGHLARATLEATAFQTREVLDAMRADSGVEITELKVDGGMVVNNLLMQFQADVLGVDVVRPQVIETTALGAAYGAGIQVDLWSVAQVRDNWHAGARWQPALDAGAREATYAQWRKAVARTLNWP